MRSVASDKIVVAIFVGMIAGSLWLKNEVHPAPEIVQDGKIERTIAQRLIARGFTVRLRRLPLGSIVVDGRRGNCIVNAHNADMAVGAESAFAQTARRIGAVGYIYSGSRYPSRPTLRLRLARLWRELAHLAGVSLPIESTIAFAETSACGGNLFGLAL